MITLQNMKFMIQIAKYKSISSAAKSLYISQSTLSSAVKNVEEQLGITLFRRNNRGVEITYEGQDFINHAQEIVEQSEYLERRYQHHKAVPMRFSVSTQRLPFAVMAFAQIVEEMTLKHYDVAIKERPTYEVIHDVASKQSDLGVLCINDNYLHNMEKLFFSNDISFHRISHLKPYVFLSKRHPLSDCESLTFNQLKDYPFITYDQGENGMLQFSEELIFEEILEKNIHVIDRCTKIALVRETDSFSIGPVLTNSNSDQMHSSLNEVCSIPLSGNNQILHIGYIKRNESVLGKISLNYLEILENKIKVLIQE